MMVLLAGYFKRITMNADKVIRKALVLKQSNSQCPTIVTALTDNQIEIVTVENAFEAVQAILNQALDFVIICADTATEAIDAVKQLKHASAIPLSTRLIVFTRNVSREVIKEALTVGVSEIYDLTGKVDLKRLFVSYDTAFYSRILLVEDNQALADMMVHILETRGHQVVHHTTAKGAHSALLMEPFDLLVTDLLLEGDKSGRDLIEFLSRRNLLDKIPALVVTSYNEPAIIADLLALGVADVAVKPIIPEVFLLRVERILKTKSYSDKLAIQSKQLLELSLTDSLTGAYNRRFMEKAIDQRLNDFKRQKEPFCVLMFDIDDFKIFNDQHGHLAGDEALKLMTKLVQAEIRNVDSFCRFGGEEFVLVLANCDEPAGMEKAQQLCQVIEQESNFTVSIGLAVFNQFQQTLSLEDILRKADSALYRAKKQGKNQVFENLSR